MFQSLGFRATMEIRVEGMYYKYILLWVTGFGSRVVGLQYARPLENEPMKALSVPLQVGSLTHSGSS